MRKTNEQRLVEDTIRNGMTKFVGHEYVSVEDKRHLIKHMADTLQQFAAISDIVAPLPEVEVRCENRIATFVLKDPKTKEPITLETWIGRSLEGFYE